MGLVGRNIAVLMGGVAVLASASVAQAQQATEEQKQARVTSLQRLVVGAGAEKVAIDTPQAVTVVEQEDLDEIQPQTLGDVLKKTPGVNLSGSERLLGQSINIRGIGGPETAGDEGRIIVNIDGVSKFYEQYRMGGLFTDMELFKRVEVLRGPTSSTLYGSGALGGVVNFTTKDASDFLEPGQKGAVRLKAAYDSNPGGWLGSAIVALKPNENFEFLAAGNYRYANAYKAGNGLPVLGSEISAPSGLAKATWRFGEANEQKLTASYQHFTTNMADQAYSQVDQETGFGTVDREVVDKTAILAYENPASDNPWIDLRIQASFSDTTVDQLNAGIPTLNRKYGYKTYQFSIDNTFDYIGNNFENYLTVGSQSNWQDRTTLRGTSGTHPQGKRFATGIFAQNEFIYDEKLTIIAGARLDWQTLTPTNIAGATEQRHTAFSPKLAAHYRFNENFALFGSIAHTERAPSIDEVFDSGALGLNLEKERSDNYEIGTALSFYDLAMSGDSLQFKTTGFYNNITNLIVDNGRTAVPRYENVGRARIYGFEVEATYDAQRWFANASYSYVIGDDLTAGTPLNTVAPHEFGLGLGFRMPEQGLTFGWDGRIVAAQNRVTGDPFQRQPSPAFSTHDIYVTWKPQDGRLKGWDATARIDNIFNADYREFLSGTPAKGRTFKLALSKQIGW